MISQRFISPPFPTSLSLKDKDPWELMGMCAMEERWEEKSQTARRCSGLPPSRSLLGWTLGHWSGGVGWSGVGSRIQIHLLDEFGGFKSRRVFFPQCLIEKLPLPSPHSILWGRRLELFSCCNKPRGSETSLESTSGSVMAFHQRSEGKLHIPVEVSVDTGHNGGPHMTFKILGIYKSLGDGIKS